MPTRRRTLADGFTSASKAHHSVELQQGWRVPVRAETIFTLFDFGILACHFGAVGDE
jgi:hypothetical protein